MEGSSAMSKKGPDDGLVSNGLHRSGGEEGTTKQISKHGIDCEKKPTKTFAPTSDKASAPYGSV